VKIKMKNDKKIKKRRVRSSCNLCLRILRTLGTWCDVQFFVVDGGAIGVCLAEECNQDCCK